MNFRAQPQLGLTGPAGHVQQLNKFAADIVADVRGLHAGALRLVDTVPATANAHGMRGDFVTDNNFAYFHNGGRWLKIPLGAW